MNFPIKIWDSFVRFFQESEVCYDSKCYGEGDDAYYAGKTPSSCPYATGDMRESWMAGYFKR